VKKQFFISFLFASITLAAVSAQADTQYVSDHLIITVRSGQGSQYQIIKTLPSGTRLNVLETTDTGYSKIETTDGIEGWVRTQYLTTEPVASQKLAKAEAELAKSQEELNKIKTNYATLRKAHASLSQEQKKLSTEKEKTDAELARISEVAKKPIILDRMNRQLQERNVSLEKDLQRLNQENHALKDRSQREWFIAGALVLFGGMLLGFILPKLRSRKRSAW
jgi:SH3 domain protein